MPEEDGGGPSQTVVPARASPRLQGILDRYGSELVDGVFEDDSFVSIHDLAFNSPGDFTIRGRRILDEARRASRQSFAQVVLARQEEQDRKVLLQGSPHMAKSISKTLPMVSTRLAPPVEGKAAKVPKLCTPVLGAAKEDALLQTRPLQ